ncbi:MAG: DUF4350 domain-containing protein [Dermatophilaceae bacterium]
MSTTATDRAAGSYTTLGPTRSGAATRLRSIAPWVAVLLLGAIALVAVGVRSGPEARFLDPRSPAPVGSMALAEVLRQNGVEVSVASTLAELPGTISPGTTVVVTADRQISREALVEVADRARGADRLVVLLAAPGAVGDLDPGLSGYTVPEVPSAPAAGCEVTGIRPGDVVTGASVLILAPGPSDAVTCLPARGIPDGGAVLARLPVDSDRPETVLVGFAGGLTNEQITGEDNAAVALRLLGQSPRLTWLIPSGVDTVSSADGSSRSPWPAWSTPVALVLVGGTVLLALVRGRRLGRLVPEPLPVIVRAAETTESRGHLYHRSRDRARTAAILREGTRTRLRQRLGVARTDSLANLLPAVAAATGESPDRIQHLLGDGEPASNADLVALGSDLADLERKVRLS